MIVINNYQPKAFILVLTRCFHIHVSKPKKPKKTKLGTIPLELGYIYS